MAQLFQKIGWFDKILAMVAYLVAVVAAGGILSGLYNTMEEDAGYCHFASTGSGRQDHFRDYPSGIYRHCPGRSPALLAIYAMIFELQHYPQDRCCDPPGSGMRVLWTPLSMILLGALARTFQP